MADVKINEKYVCGDEFKVSTGDKDAPEEYYSLTHNSADAIAEIGYGSKVIEFTEPLLLVDDAYYDLPANSCGYGFVGVGSTWARFYWDTDNTVTLVDNSTDVDNADTDGKLCIFAVTTPNVVRIKNRLAFVARFILKVNYTETPIAPTFKVFNLLSGVDQLDPNLTINGTTVTPDFRYKGGDADGTDWDPWGYGEALNLTSTPVPSYNQGSPGLGSNDDSVKFNNGGTYYGTTASYGDVTTEDLVVELVFKTDTIGSTESIWSKRTPIGDVEGVYVYQSSGGVISLVLDPGAAAAASISSAVLNSNTWYHVLWFVNRDEASTNGGQAYINGVASGSGVDCSSASTTLTNSNYLRMGGNQGGGANGYQHLAYTAMWKQASWHQAGASGPAEWATIAAERFARFAGYYPEIANGTYLPTVKTRAYSAYLDKVEGDYRKLYYVGPEWLRMSHRVDSNAENVRGYLPETQVENICGRSEEFAVGWTPIQVGDSFTDNQVVCPDGRVAAASYTAGTVDGGHGAYRAYTHTAATITASIFAKPGNKTWVQLMAATICDCYFDIENGVVGTATSCVGHIEGPFYGGFYRCGITYTGDGASHGFRIYPAEADGDVEFQGDSVTVNTYWWGAQAELGDYMTSPIQNIGSSTYTRLKDQLRYVAGDNLGGEDVGQLTIVSDMLQPSYTITNYRYIVDITDGGSSTDRILLYTEDTLGKARAYATATGLDAGVSTDSVTAFDNQKHSLRGIYQTDNVYLRVDGVDKTADSSADIPDDLDRLDVGNNRSLADQFSGLIQSLRIYSEPTLKG